MGRWDQIQHLGQAEETHGEWSRLGWLYSVGLVHGSSAMLYLVAFCII